MQHLGSGFRGVEGPGLRGFGQGRPEGLKHSLRDPLLKRRQKYEHAMRFDTGMIGILGPGSSKCRMRAER